MANNNPRARSLGIPFDGTPGRLNAITDVAGVAVGHTTLISGDGKLRVGKGPIRTGVTAVLPRGKDPEPVFAAWHTLNGCGEMTGTTWVEESGYLYGPVMITNTLSVSMVRDATIVWGSKKVSPWFSLPVVAETYDGSLNDIRGLHVKQAHVWRTLNSASSGAVAEGNVGGGTGMICHDTCTAVRCSAGVSKAASARRLASSQRSMAAIPSACSCKRITVRESI